MSARPEGPLRASSPSFGPGSPPFLAVLQVLVLLLGTVGQTASAQQSHPSRAEPQPTPPSKEASPGAAPFAEIEVAPTPAPPSEVPRRPVPDYEGRGPEPTTTGDVLIWIPRVVLIPPYLVAEYLIAKPVGWLATTAEENGWPNLIYNFFTFGPNHQGGLFPTFAIDFGLRPSIGLHFFWNNTFVEGNRFTVDAAWGGHQWGTIAVGDRYQAPDRSVLSIQARWDRRPDTPYFGIGSQSLDSDRSRIGSDVVAGIVEYQTSPALLRLLTTASVQRLVFRDYTCCGDPSLQQQVESGRLPAPPGFNENTTFARIRVRAILDTRNPGRLDQSGVRVAMEVSPAVDLVRGFDRSWIAYATGIEGSWDVTGKARVLTLGVVAYFVDPMGSQPVPFTELVTLGGSEPLAGYLPGRLRDRSGLVARLAWHWPVFAFLNGIAGVSFGNVFDAHLQNLAFDLLRLSAELGLESQFPGAGGGIEFVMGIGTETFRDGLRLTSFRLAFGVKYGL